MFSDYMTLADFRREIPIMELAISIGYELLPREGMKWPVMKNPGTGEKIIIVNPANPGNQGYFNPNDDNDKGILTDFIYNRLGTYFEKDPLRTDYENIYSFMYAYTRCNTQSIVPKIAHRESMNALTSQKTYFCLKQGLLRPLTDKSFLRARGLSENTLNAPIFACKIFNTYMYGHTNTAFPYNDISGNATALEVRNQGFKHFYPGSTLDSSVWHSQLTGDKDHIILAESPVDALSYHQLKGSEKNIYVAFGGSISQGQLEMVKWIRGLGGNNLPIISAVDNDAPGEAYNLKFQTVLGQGLEFDPPEKKDYNEQLMQLIKKKGISYQKRR